MNETKHTPVSRKFYPLLVAAAVVFVILRYSQLLLELFLKLRPGSLAPTGISMSLSLLVGFIAIFVSFTWLIRRNFSLLLTWFESHPKRFLVVALILMTFVIGWGKVTFSVYTDEKRDVFVVNLLSRVGLDAYLDLKTANTKPMNSEERGFLNWARSLHPAGHYLPAIIIGAEKSTIFWRFFYWAFPLLLVGVLIWLWRPLDERRIWFIALTGILIVSFTYFRNYVLIRFGNELITTLAMSCFFLILYQTMMRRTVQCWIGFLGMTLFFFIAITTKYSALVTWFAAVIGTGVVFISKRDSWSRLAFLLCLGAGIIALMIHSAVWMNSDMLMGHRNNYAVKIFKIIGIMPPDWMHPTGSGLEGSSSSIPLLLLGAPVWFGPFLFSGFLAGCWVFLREKLWHEPLWLFLAVFLAANLIGVMAVNPRAAYLSPAVLPFAFFGSLAYFKLLKFRQCQEVFFIAYAFILIDILILTLN